MSNTETLTEAHEQWANRPADQRFESVEALTAAVSARRLRSRSVDVDCDRTEVRAEGNLLTINGTLSPSIPTHWSFGQLSSLVGAPAGYLRTLPKPTVAALLNYGLKNADRQTVKFMTIAPEGDGVAKLQAVTSKTYGRIWDADVCAALTRLQERTGGKFYNPKAYDIATGKPKPSGLYASDRDMFAFMIDGGSLLDAGPRAQINRGFFLWNSETGARTMGLKTFLFNYACGNHYVWGAHGVNEMLIRHSQNGPARFDSEAAPALLAYANASAAPIESGIRRAQYMVIGANDKEVTEWALKNGKFSRPEIAEAIATAKREEGQCRSLWDFCQGLTAYARGFDFIDSRLDLETRASSLLKLVME